VCQIGSRLYRVRLARLKVKPPNRRLDQHRNKRSQTGCKDLRPHLRRQPRAGSRSQIGFPGRLSSLFKANRRLLSRANLALRNRTG
jgi:hypothetical protein